MITLRKAETRGHAGFGWLDTWHTFSFSSWQDPRYMGVSALRVINQDVVKPATGFPMHGHDNMEILTYVLRGAVSHRDSMGNQARVAAGEFQLMSAGTGITHAEYNMGASDLELLQIWLYPNVQDAEPTYQQKRFDEVSGLQLVVSPDGADDSLHIRQDARIYRGRLAAGESVTHTLAGKAAYMQVITGELRLNDNILQAGDGAEADSSTALAFVAHTDTEFLLFDLP
jgi:redox-sensitive bicupin YhaK (pirin superfamily)